MLIGISYIFLIGFLSIIGYLATQFSSTKHSAEMKLGLWFMIIILALTTSVGTHHLMITAINNMTN